MMMAGTVRCCNASVGLVIGSSLSSCFSFFLFLLLFLNICDGAFWGKKNVKVVELSQFESFGGLSVTFETLEVKVKMDGYFRG
jgi:hypothetical protein